MHNYDHNTLERYLQEHLDSFGKLIALEKFPDGQSNPTYKLVGTDKTYVLRAKPPGKLLKSAHAVDREYRIMAALANTDVPVPKVHHLSAEDSTPLGSQFLIMEMVDGRIFWDPSLPELSNHERGAIFDAMNATLAALHSVDVDAAGLADFGKPGNYFERQLSRWSQHYLSSASDPSPDVQWLIDWLSENMVAEDGQVSIVHGDYRIDNMIFMPEDPGIAALLDWELSTLGHPFADLAYQCMQWELPNGGNLSGLGGIDRAAFGLPSQDDYVAAYCERRGIPHPDNWTFYVAFSNFRLLAILEGVVQRGKSGNASNARSTKVWEDLIELLTDNAVALARAAG